MPGGGKGKAQPVGLCDAALGQAEKAGKGREGRVFFFTPFTGKPEKSQASGRQEESSFF
jgi:hypothetical protein